MSEVYNLIREVCHKLPPLEIGSVAGMRTVRIPVFWYSGRLSGAGMDGAGDRDENGDRSSRDLVTGPVAAVTVAALACLGFADGRWVTSRSRAASHQASYPRFPARRTATAATSGA
jgi:hypothetical protein